MIKVWLYISCGLTFSLHHNLIESYYQIGIDNYYVKKFKYFCEKCVQFWMFFYYVSHLRTWPVLQLVQTNSSIKVICQWEIVKIIHRVVWRIKDGGGKSTTANGDFYLLCRKEIYWLALNHKHLVFDVPKYKNSKSAQCESFNSLTNSKCSLIQTSSRRVASG